ncbi:hypothetical protein L1987_57418 [Smallanthus sonchifolius]|uniref:Uncharacterized protein n=1 Tax=Smallanthus sonchifolius TaxID=185202 RepID=A0ACB9DCF7_9ASTR|nr:hypothetical protein L1987_57418 [Smallanthus sonchifolius]
MKIANYILGAFRQIGYIRMKIDGGATKNRSSCQIKGEKFAASIDIDKDFLGSWKSISMGDDDGMDFDSGPTTKGKQKAFKIWFRRNEQANGLLHLFHLLLNTDVLFPYTRDKMCMHLEETYDIVDTKDDIKLLRSQVEDDLEKGVVGAVPVPSDDVGKEEVIAAALVANVEEMIKADRKSTSLKQLQGHI